MSKECTTHHHACDCREEKFKQLEQENAALRADKERLDWLDANGDPVTYEDAPHSLHWGITGDPGCRNLRAAIDAAREEAQP